MKYAHTKRKFTCHNDPKPLYTIPNNEGLTDVTETYDKHLWKAISTKVIVTFLAYLLLLITLCSTALDIYTYIYVIYIYIYIYIHILSKIKESSQISKEQYKNTSVVYGFMKTVCHPLVITIITP